MKKWKGQFFRPRYTCGDITIAFARSEGRGGFIDYVDPSGTYAVPYELGAGDIAYAISEDYITKRGSDEDVVPPAKRQKIVADINEAICEHQGARVVSI